MEAVEAISVFLLKESVADWNMYVGLPYAY